MQRSESSGPTVFEIFARHSLSSSAAALEETEGHHPEITFGSGYATISMHTKKIKGLH
jgi:pterin-4a-carbinolamine dehydratase